MSKKLTDCLDKWDIHLNQVLAAIKFNITESTEFSPFYLLYNHDLVLPINNILKPIRRCLREEPHKLGLEQQHNSFVLVHQHLKQTKRRQARYADNNSQYKEFQVGDPTSFKDKGCLCIYVSMILSILNSSSAKVSYKESDTLIIG